MTTDAFLSARHWAVEMLDELGLGFPSALEILAGGRNNRAFRVSNDRGAWVLKQYYSPAAGTRDRCRSEWDWLNFCWSAGVRCVPQPLYCRADQQVSLLSFVEGRRLAPTEVNEARVLEAANFVDSVNRFRRLPAASTISNAAEACFSIMQHLDCVDRRIARLESAAVDDSVAHEMHAWLRACLRPAWAEIQSALHRQVTPDVLNWEIPLERRCLSPSDFGFHNALLTPDGSLTFLDFEYAGWDDPAKLVCDFFWQPEIPAPPATKVQFTATLGAMNTDDQFEQRVQWLNPVFGVKWCCLFLNEFLRTDRNRRDFALTTAESYRNREEQLARAMTLLAKMDFTH